MTDKSDWLLRVLGVQVPEKSFGDRAQNSGFDAQAWSAARARWNDALDDVNRQVGTLQSRLRNSEDSELRDIAEYGLSNVTGRRRVALTTALLQVGDGKGVGNAMVAIQGMRRFLTESDVIEACDRNPFGVAVSIRATLDPALETMEKVLGR